ncbi:Frag1/DRAM/Sfk1 family [Nesidiocoris tenuis]|uniref:Frag1/DRAM/Sfk1 family n=1 Tax=Nesidiocoris tenuis TaxID=355587 RepID=A0ABN7AQU6_9HEMI|nr:Frag1/DRAM/Sfk1 family [Nesidiocoris tenuis]
MGVHRNLEVFPMAVCLLGPITFCLTFVLAVKLGHVSMLIPYISYTGEMPPEKNLFSQFLNITAFLLAICVYIRHVLVSTASEDDYLVNSNVNGIATAFGLVSCFGMCTVANFQVNNVRSVHYFGAFLCFVGGNVYFLFQTIFSYRLSYMGHNKDVLICRLVLCLCAFAFNVITVVTGVLSYRHFRGKDPNHWTPEEDGFIWHISSATAEWLLTFVQSMLVLTFFPEFKAVQIRAPTIKIENMYTPLVNFDDIA